jgi:leukocyte elastase inhibitor
MLRPRFSVFRYVVGISLCATALMSAGAAAQRATDKTPVRLRALAHAYNASGQDLFARFVSAPGNVVYSPYSIGTAMAMALSGARAGTETEMARVLRHTLVRPEIDAANRELIGILNAYQKASATPPLKLDVANALMITKGHGLIAPAYAAVLHDKYAAELFEGADLVKVNEWVKRKTEGKIEKILDRLDPNTVAVLINAVYFKAPWERTFDRQATRNEDFNLASGKAAVPTMHAEGRYAVSSADGYKAIRLPYAGNALAMVVVLPEQGIGTEKVAARLGADALTALFSTLESQSLRPVDLALPRFKTGYRASLLEPFAALGMKRAFSLSLADFSGMSGRPSREVRIAIGAILHRAVIDVNEEGTEASAATGIGMQTTAMRPQPPEPFHVDRPFLFYIVDNAAMTVLFQGRIADPRAN